MNYKGLFYKTKEVILLLRKVISFTLFTLLQFKKCKKKRLSQKRQPPNKNQKKITLQKFPSIIANLNHKYNI